MITQLAANSIEPVLLHLMLVIGALCAGSVTESLMLKVKVCRQVAFVNALRHAAFAWDRKYTTADYADCTDKRGLVFFQSESSA
jgi:hypothetical protein